MRHEGGCHCGAIRIVYESKIPAEEAMLRACQCDFCRRHGALAVSDPDGRAIIDIKDESTVRRYRFGLRTADYLVCGRCGVYVAAVMEAEGGAHAVVMVRALDDAKRFSKPARPVDFDDEAPDERMARRRRTWTPASYGSTPRL